MLHAAIPMLALASAGAAHAEENALPAGFKTETLLKTSVTREDDAIVYPSGKPQIISVIGTMEKDGRTALHEHPVPVFVYVLEGEIELRSDNGKPQRYKAGEAFIEALDRKHQAHNVADSASRILVVFVGEDGKPTTVASGQ
jgi:quercetin dioxygenase-like cupin family protein